MRVSRTGEQLAPAKRQVLDRRIRQAAEGGVAAAPAIEVLPHDGHAPLSFSQERLWVLDQLGTLGAAYNIPEFYRIEGDLNVAALERAYQEVVRRHESLRTRFVLSGGQPIQIIDRPSFRIAFKDLTPLSRDARAVEAEQLARETAKRPFDLTISPLLRVLVLKLTETEHDLIVVVHHIAADGWSMEVLAREIKQLYAAFVSGQPSSLAALPMQYAEYALWQRKWMQGEVLGKHLSYWLEALKGAPALLALPTDKPRPSVQTFNGATTSLALPPEMTNELAELGRGEGATVFMVLLAAFQIVLSRWSGQDDVVVGAPIRGRIHQGTQEMIGLFVNMLALRASLADAESLSFRAFLQRVREMALGAYAHQEIPYERLLEELRPARTLSHSPLFQVVLNMLDFGERGPDTSRLQLKAVPERDPTPRFDLTLYVIKTGGRLVLSAVYNSDLFLPSRMMQLLEQLSLLLKQIVREPDRLVSSFSLLTPSARRILPDPAVTLGDQWHGAVHDLFVQRAQQFPRRPAIITSMETFTYGELDELSSRLALCLRASGIKRGDVVAIYACRGASIVYAILGILKAGAAFTILDPAYPASRLIACIKVARPRAWLAIAEAGACPVAVTEVIERLACRCRLLLRERQIELDGKPVIDVVAVEPPVQVGADDIAAITFTSGSTGLPKGVEGRHGPLSHFIPWLSKIFKLDHNDRFSMVSGISHDPLQRDIFTPLCLGAAICVPDADDILLPGRMAAWMQRNRVTVAHLTPGLGQALSHLPNGNCGPAAERPKIASLRLAFFVGDVLTRRDVDLLKAIAPSITCVNYYGSTETQRSVGYYVVPDDPPGDQSARLERQKQVLPLGNGIEDVQLVVMNGSRQLAGIGELGEIYVRSHHLARGYIGDRVSTDQGFIVNPFGRSPADRLYRTGDLGRYLPDGNVEFAGRADNQMKVNGYRIEAGEIESSLLTLPDVRDAVVTAREDSPGEKRLVAYIVPKKQGTGLAAAAIREWLRNRLPQYMIPASFVTLERLPLTPNGKVDRRALPAPEAPKGVSGLRLAPRTEIEKLLVSIWCKVLGLSELGIDSNFFELGGHSLRAARVIAWVRVELNLDIPLRALFEAPTIAELSTWINVVRGANRMAALQPQPRCADVPTTPAQELLLHIHRAENPGAAFNIAYGVGLVGKLDVGSLERSFSEMVYRHESLRTHFSERNGVALQVIDPPWQFRIEVLDISDLPEGRRKATAKHLAGEQRQKPFDLERGPLIRVALLRLSPEEHHLVVVMHHTISDGWSVQLLLKEVRAVYESLLQGNPSPLPHLTLQYADFAIWQRTKDYREAFELQLDYWIERLAGAPLLELRLDRERPERNSYNGAIRSLTLTRKLTEDLRKTADDEGATLFMLLFAAFAATLSCWSGQTDIVIGTPVSGRHEASTEKLLGLFMNILPMRIDMSEHPSFRELLKRVKIEILANHAHPDPSAAQLQAELQRRGRRGGQPLFRVVLAMQNVPVEQVSLIGLRPYPIEIPVTTARRDLTLYVYDSTDRIYARIEYATDIFEATTIESLQDRLVALLTSCVEDPGRKVAEVLEGIAAC